MFEVFSRAFQRQCGSRITGKLEVYVDNFMAASPAVTARDDQLVTKQFVCRACGPKAINVLKSLPPAARTVEFIGGWLLIDLNIASLRPNDKGIRKLVVFFFGCLIHKPLPLHDYQVLASLACRYSIGLRPYAQPLYVMTRGWSSNQVRKRPTSSAKQAIIVLKDPLRLAIPSRGRIISFPMRALWPWGLRFIPVSHPSAWPMCLIRSHSRR